VGVGVEAVGGVADVVVGGDGVVVVEGVVGEGFRFCFWMDWTPCGGVFFFSFFFATFISGLVGEERGCVPFQKVQIKKIQVMATNTSSER